MQSDPVLGPQDHDGSPLRNSALEEAMREASAHDSPESRALLYQLLLDARVVVAIPEAPTDPGTRIAQPGESIAIVTGMDEDGAVLPVFTNAEAVLTWRPERQGVMTLPARAVFQMAAAQETNKLVINPGSETWGYLTRREIKALALGRLPHPDGSEAVTEETAVRIGRPSAMPSDEALAAVTKYVADEPSAVRAWVFLIQQGESPVETAVAVAFDADPDPADGDATDEDATDEDASDEDASDEDASGPKHRVAMRRIVEESGTESPEAATFVFLVADESWQESLAGGAGVEIFSR